jgi:adenine phosphoribosyltransferase
VSGKSTNHEKRIELLRARVRDIPDFPKPGILFRDLTPLMGHGPSMKDCIALLAEKIAAHRPETIVAIESRGFIFGAPVAAALGVGFAPVRKPGKLPYRTHKRTYDLEYGTDSLEMHADAVVEGTSVVVVDDLLATGGTAAATVDLVRQQGGRVSAVAVVVELQLLNGRARLDGVAVESLIQY